MYSDFSAGRRQQGVSLSGLLTWLVVVVLVVILGMRLLPVYTEFIAIKQVLVTIANNPEFRTAGTQAIRQAFDKQAAVNDIKSVNGSDIVIEKQNEQVVLNVSYTVTKPLFSNLSLQIDLDATSN